jgi:hypothetical protein
MKLKNIFIGVLFLFSIGCVFSQLNPPIPNPKKITFTYKTNPNIFFINDELYADTLVFKGVIPKVKYKLITSPKDSTKIIGTIKKEQIKTKYLKELAGFISHNSSIKEIQYVVSERKSAVKMTPSTQECEEFFIQFFKRPYVLFDNAVKKIELLYDDENKKFTTKTAYSNSSNSYSRNFLKWYPNFPDVGSYETDDLYIQKKQTNAVVIDKTLDKHISPIPLFGNCNYGITTVISRFYTTTLISVQYE